MQLRLVCAAASLLAFFAALCHPCGAQNLSEQYLLSAANQDRAQQGLPPLRVDLQLVQAARQHAAQMVQHGTISHQFEGEPDLAQRAGSAGARFSLVTENVAEASNSALIHQLWMNSAGHRRNLLDPQVDSVGIAVLQLHGQLYAVEDFARAVQSLPLDRQEAAVAALLSRSGIDVAPSSPEARATCTMSTGYAGARQPWFVMRYTAASLDRLPDELTARLASGKYHQAQVGACTSVKPSPFTSYSVAVLLYP